MIYSDVAQRSRSKCPGTISHTVLPWLQVTRFHMKMYKWKKNVQLIIKMQLIFECFAESAVIRATYEVCNVQGNIVARYFLIELWEICEVCWGYWGMRRIVGGNTVHSISCGRIRCNTLYSRNPALYTVPHM